MEMNLGVRGATGDSWRLKSVRNLFATLIDSHPQATETQLVDLCVQRILDDEEYALAAAQYIVRNALQAQEDQKRRTQSNKPAPVIAAERQEREAKIQQIADQIMLLNQEMPNGKRLRYCTREELAGFNKGYDKMIKKMKPGQMVGQAFSEDQVKEIMK
jgi:hypothetical protein